MATLLDPSPVWVVEQRSWSGERFLRTFLCLDTQEAAALLHTM